MLKRSLTGACIAVVIYTAVWFSDRPAVIPTASALLSMLAIWELHRATGQSRCRLGIALLWVLTIGINLAPIPSYPILLAAVLLLAAAIFAAMAAHMDTCSLDTYGCTLALSCLVTVLFRSLPHLAGQPNGRLYLLFSVTVCFVTDVAALFTGKLLGRRKLCPKISPNKTVAGAVGGVLFSCLAMAALGLASDRLGTAVSMGRLLCWAVPASVAGQLGDLAFSVIKRICRIKDYGHLLPGHGGILDRFDSHLFAVPFTVLYVAFTGGFFL